MKSPLNPSNTPLSDMDPDTAGQLLELYSHITTLNQEVTETMELLSTITSHAVCLKVTEKHTHAHWRPSEQLELVYAAIERLEQSIVTQHASNQFMLQHPQSGSGNNRNFLIQLYQATTNSNQSIGLTSPRRYQSVNRNKPETPTSRFGGPSVAVTSPRFVLAPPLSPSVNTSPSKGHPAATASPPVCLNVLLIKTPQQVVSDLASISDIGSFYIVTKGREPGIYTDWPKAEALVCGMRHSVYCKKYNKSEAIQVYMDAYEENRVERVSK